RRAVFNGPVLDGDGDGVGDGRVERLAAGDGAAKGLVDVAGQLDALHLVVEDQTTEGFGDLGGGTGLAGFGDGPVPDGTNRFTRRSGTHSGGVLWSAPVG